MRRSMDDLTGEYVHTMNQPVKTLRDEFAMAALNGILSNSARQGRIDEYTNSAYRYAETMLKARQKEQP